MTSTDTDYRVCLYCRDPKPIGEFRRRKRGDDSRRVNQCSTCYAKAMRAYRANRKHKKMARFVRRASRTNDPRLLGTFVGLAIRDFGGVESFTEKFVELSRSGSPTQALMVFNALVNLVIANDTLNPPPKPSQMSDEDLAMELAAHYRAAGYELVKITPDED